MSGLSVFFRQYRNSAVGDVAVDDTNHNESDREVNPQPPHPSRDDDQVSLYEQSITITNITPTVNPNAARRNSTNDEVSFKVWRQQQCSCIQDYMAQRLFDTNTETDTTTAMNDEPTQTEEEEDDDHEVESQPFDSFASQPPLLESQLQGPASSFTPTTAAPKTTWRTIPNVRTDTYIMATHIQELDLYTHTFQPLAPCPIQKVWSKRTTLTRRRRHSRSNPTTTTTTSCFQYDGPLAVLYDRVLSMELFQHPMTLGSASHMKLFWYDRYADVLDTILTEASQYRVPPPRVSAATPADLDDTVGPETSRTVELYLSLQHIPAQCIFPYYDPSEKEPTHLGTMIRPDWYDRHHILPYCIGIGGDSAMIVQAPTGTNPEDSQETVDPTNPVWTCPIAFDRDDRPKSEPMSIICYVVVMASHGAVPTNHDRDSVDDDPSLPLTIVEYPIPNVTPPPGPGPPPLPKNIYRLPADKETIRTIWAQVQRQRPHVSSSSSSSASTKDRNAIHPYQPTWRRPNTISNPPDDPPPVATTNDPPAPPSTPPPTTRRAVSSLTSPGARLKRRRLDNVATDDLQYQLSDIPNLPLKTPFSFYAAVLSFNQPYRTKRGDWTMSLQLVDDSLQLCEDGLVELAFINSVTCNIFVKPGNYETLPMIRYAGDIVRLSNVYIQSWNDELQLVSTKNSTYVTLRGNGMKPDGTQTNPEMFPTDDENVVLSDEEWEHMLDMWHWAQRRMMLHATMKVAHRFRLSDMHLPDSTHTEEYGEANTRGDLTAMVAAVIPIVTDSSVAGVTPRGFLRVWDGTGIPKSDVLPIDSEEARTSVQDGDPPPDALIKMARIVRKLKELRQNEDIQPPAKLSGRVANVAIWEKQHWELIETGYVTVGTFIRLRNVQDTVFPNSNFRCLHVHAKSSLTPLPNFNFEVLHLLEEHNNRLLRMDPTNDDCGLLPLFVDNQLQHYAVGTPQRARTGELLDVTNGLRSSAGSNKDGIPRSHYYTSLKDFMDAPVPSSFLGEVDVSGMYPSTSDLMQHGVDLICMRNTDNTDRFYRFGLQVRGTTLYDNMALASVIVSDDRPGTAAGKQLFSIACSEGTQNSAPIIEISSRLQHEKIRRKAKITSIEYNASKYFLLDHLQ